MGILLCMSCQENITTLEGIQQSQMRGLIKSTLLKEKVDERFSSRNVVYAEAIENTPFLTCL